MLNETDREQVVWEHYKRIEEENYKLRNEVAKKEREINTLKRIISKLNYKNKKKKRLSK